MATFSVVMENTTIAADATLIILRSDNTGAQGSILEVLRATVSQNATETAQTLGIILARKEATMPTVTGATPRPHTIGGAVSGIVSATDGAVGTCGVDASVEGAGTVTAFHSEGFDNRNGWLWVPTPEERPILMDGEAMIVKIRGTPATLTNWEATLTFREIA